MIGTGGDRYLTWAFAVALLAHACALSAGARLSAAPNGNGALDAVRVFDVSAPVLMTPVALVEWKGDGGELAVTVEMAANLPVAATSNPISGRFVRQVRRAPTRAGRDAGRGGKPAGGGKAQTGPGGGGGGGGFVNLGSPSPNGDLSGAPSGGTPAAELPGIGEGSGSGAGPGTGSGSGGGVGSGTGTGAGEGSGPGTGGGAGGPGTAGEGSGFESRVADRREPEVASKGKLSYPESAIEEGVEGTVQLEVLVTEAGEAAEVEVVKSSGDRRLDAAAKEFVRGWRYLPAVQDGKPRRVHSIATVVFQLE